MRIETYSTLPVEAVKIRKSVFVEEQKFHNEFDETDNYSQHLVVFDKNTPIATCRFYCKNKKRNTDYVIGRIAVLKQYRGQNIGSLLLKAAELEIIKTGGKKIYLHAQENVKKFYLKHGYCQCGETDLDENCPHIWMYKEAQTKE